MTDLDLSYNELSSFQEDQFSRHRIGALFKANFSHNRIDYIDVHALRTQLHLKVLDLSFNRLSRIHPRTFQLHTTQLEWLSLGANPNIYLMQSGSSLISYSLGFLDLSRCNISSIPNNTFKHLRKLHTLDLSHNNLKTLLKESFFGLVSLNALDLSYNHLQCLQITVLDNMSKLISVTLVNNPLFTPKALLRLLNRVEGRRKRSASLVSKQYHSSQQCVCSLIKFYLHQRNNGNVTIEMGEGPTLSDEEWDTLSGYKCESLLANRTAMNSNVSSTPLVTVTVNTNSTSSPTKDLEKVTPKTAGTRAGWIIGLIIVWILNVVVSLLAAHIWCNPWNKKSLNAKLRFDRNSQPLLSKSTSKDTRKTEKEKNISNVGCESPFSQAILQCSK